MDPVTLDLERSVACDVETVRTRLITALRGLGFTVGSSSSSGIEARRGSAVRATYGNDAPVRASVTLVSHTGTACQVRVHLAGGTGVPFTGPASLGQLYEGVMRGIHEALDAALAVLDPASVPTWPAPDFRVAPIPALAQAMSSLSGVASRVPGSLGRSLRDRAPVQEVGVVVTVPGAVARLTPDDLQTHLAIARMIGGTSGALPEQLAGDLGEVALALARATESPTPPETRIEAPGRHKPVYVFVHQQVLIRAGLPLRELHRCRECRFEKIVNPDYKALLQRNRRLQKITGLAGLTVGMAGPSMLLVAGRLLNMRQTELDHVCPRCQGMEADVSLITICPGCSEIRKEPVLRRCPRAGCGFDFPGSLGTPPPFWGPPEAARPEAPPPADPAVVHPPAPPAAPAASPRTPPVVPAAAYPPAPPAAPAAAYPPAPPAAPAWGAPPSPHPQAPASPSGWFADPYRRHPYRYFDGVAWTAWVSDGRRSFPDR